MHPWTVVRLWRLRVRARWATELLAAVGIAAGVALFFAALVANASLTSSVDALTRGVVGDAQFQLIARGPSGMSERLAERASQLDSVKAAAPVIEYRVGVVGPRGRAWVTLLGGDSRFATMSGSLNQLAAPELNKLRAIGLPSAVAEQIGLRPYSQVAIESGTGLRQVLGIRIGTNEIGMLANSAVALMPLSLAQEVAGMPGRVSRVFLAARPGEEATARQQVQAIAGTVADVRSPDYDVDVFAAAASPTQQSTTLFAALAAGVGFLFASCAVLLTARSRASFCERLRMDGNSRATVLVVMIFDAVVLGLVGAAAGLVAGDQLSRHILNEPPGYLATGFPIGTDRVITAEAVSLAILGGLVAAVAAVLLPLHATLFPRGGGSRSADGIAATVVGFTAVLTAVAITWWWPTAALAGLVALTIGVLLLLPAILRGVVALLASIAWRIPAAAPYYAALQLRSTSAATISRALAATGALAAFALVAIGGARDDLVRGLDGGAQAIDRNADVWITSNGPTRAYAVTPFASQRLRTDLERIAGVRRVSTYRGSWLDVEDLRAWVQAPPRDAPAPAPPGQLRDGDLVVAERAMRTGGNVILSEAIARSLDAHIGQAVTLPTPKPLTVRVAAISNNLGWPSGTIILNADDYAAGWRSGAASALLVETAEDATAEDVVVDARTTIARHGLPLSVETASERINLHGTAAREGLVRLSQITLLVAIAAALAMAAAMGGIILQRRAVIAQRKVEGLTTGQMWTALLIESTVLVGTGCVAGAAAGLLGQTLLARALETITGFPLDHALALGVALRIVGAIFVLALAIITLPGWGAARVAPSTETQAA